MVSLNYEPFFISVHIGDHPECEVCLLRRSHTYIKDSFDSVYPLGALYLADTAGLLINARTSVISKIEKRQQY